MDTPVTLLVLIATAVTTLVAFYRREWWERWMFKPFDVLRYKQYDRLFTSGLIHADWMHFAFNAFSFYCFAGPIEAIYGASNLLFIYLSAILGGSLLSLAIHRNNDHYRALGASGGVCGIIFACIFLLPGSSIVLFPFSIRIPAYLYAVLFLVGSFAAHRERSDNIGHDAHLGGAIIGLLVATALFPERVLAAPWMFATVLALSVVILVVLLLDPFQLREWRLDRDSPQPGGERAKRYAENRERNERMAEIDKLLDKAAKEGIQNLSASERKRLDELSREMGAGR